MVVGRRWPFLLGVSLTFPGPQLTVKLGGRYQGFRFQLITAPVEQILKNFHDVTTRWEQSIKASSQLLRATLLHKETFFDDVIPVDYNFLRCGVAICGALTSHRMNSLSLKTTSRSCLFCEGKFQQLPCLMKQRLTSHKTRRPGAHLWENGPAGWKCHAEHAECSKDWVTGISGYHGISSASSEVTKTYKKHVLNDRRKAFFFSNRSPDQEPKMCQLVGFHQQKSRYEVSSPTPLGPWGLL